MLSPAEVSQFEDQGFLVLENVIDQASVLDPVIQEYEVLLETLRTDWIADGKIDPAAPAGNFEERIISAYRAGLDYFQPMDISLPGGQIDTDTPFHAGDAIFELITDSRLLDVVESIIGPEIASNPIQHVRIKPPAVDLDSGEIRAHITATDWHQDRAVTLAEADRTRMVTAWVAVATLYMGEAPVYPLPVE